MINETHNTQTTAGEVREIMLHLTREEITALNMAAARRGVTAPQLLERALASGTPATHNPAA